MEVFLQITAGILLTLILYLTLEKTSKETAVLLVIFTCCAAGLSVVGFLKPVLALLEQLETNSGIDSNLLTILLKAVGIGILAQIAGIVCSDAGSAALGKILQILASAAILWMAIPLFESLMSLLGEILGEV